MPYLVRLKGDKDPIWEEYAQTLVVFKAGVWRPGVSEYWSRAAEEAERHRIEQEKAAAPSWNNAEGTPERREYEKRKLNERLDELGYGTLGKAAYYTGYPGQIGEQFVHALAPIGLRPGPQVVELGTGRSYRGGPTLSTFVGEGGKVLSGTQAPTLDVRSDFYPVRPGNVPGAFYEGLPKLAPWQTNLPERAVSVNPTERMIRREGTPTVIRYPIREAKTPAMEGSRQQAIDRAWKLEVELIRRTGKGTAPWTAEEIKAILGGKGYRELKYTGHHINSFADLEEWKGDPRNIAFLRQGSGESHMTLGHPGGTSKAQPQGDLIDRQAMLNALR